MKKLVWVLLFGMAACSGEGRDVDLEGNAVDVLLDVFSGRPNPAFRLDSSEVATLEGKLRNLQPGEDQSASEPLGYRGFLIQQSGTVIRIANGLIVEESGEGKHVYRDSHSAEQYLIEVATNRGYGDLIGTADSAPAFQ